ncbi:MAG: acyl carrier protein [bacterium]|nr:acyl carrier protein [bacterium]
MVDKSRRSYMGNPGTLNIADIKETMKEFITGRFLTGAGVKNIDDDDSFLENGIIDSTGVLELVTFTEETFDIDIEDEELIPDNLDSLDKITYFIRQKTENI